jgi:CheY-like chemotaxis protein
MTIYDQSILLVGREFLKAPAITDWFLKRQRGCVIASTIGEVGELIKERKFDLVLSSYHLPDGTSLALIDRFRNLPVSLFLSHPVEDGCIWLPGILRGVACWGAAALKPLAFVRLLTSLILGNEEGYGTGNDPIEACGLRGSAQHLRAGYSLESESPKFSAGID